MYGISNTMSHFCLAQPWPTWYLLVLILSRVTLMHDSVNDNCFLIFLALSCCSRKKKSQLYVLDVRRISLIRQKPCRALLILLGCLKFAQNFCWIITFLLLYTALSCLEHYKLYHDILHGYTVHQQYPTLYFTTDAHNVKKRRFIKTF